jgi:transposase
MKLICPVILLTMDLRSRALAAVDEGMSCRAAARRFGVAAATVI